MAHIMMFEDGLLTIQLFNNHFMWMLHLYDFLVMVLYGVAAFGIGRLALKLPFWRFLTPNFPVTMLIGLSVITFCSAVLAIIHLFFVMRYVLFLGVGVAVLTLTLSISKVKVLSRGKHDIPLLFYILFVVLFLLTAINQVSRRGLNADDDYNAYIVAPVVVAKTNTLPCQPFNYRETIIYNGGSGLYAPVVLLRNNPQVFIYLDVILGFMLIAWILRDYYQEILKSKWPILLGISLVMIFCFVKKFGTVNTTPVVLGIAMLILTLPKIRDVLQSGDRTSAAGLGILLATAALWKGHFLIVVAFTVVLVLLQEVWERRWSVSFWKSLTIRRALWLTVGGLIVYAPWIWHKWFCYGVIFYPVLGLGNYTPELFRRRLMYPVEASFLYESARYIQELSSFFLGNARWLPDVFLLIGSLIVLFYKSLKENLLALVGGVFLTTIVILATMPSPWWDRFILTAQLPVVALLFVHLLASFEIEIENKSVLKVGTISMFIIAFVGFSFPVINKAYSNVFTSNINPQSTASIRYQKTSQEAANLVTAIYKNIPADSTILYFGHYAPYLPFDKYQILYSDGLTFGIKEINSLKDAGELREILVKRNIRYLIMKNSKPEENAIRGYLNMYRAMCSNYSRDIEEIEPFLLHVRGLYDTIAKQNNVDVIYTDKSETIYKLNAK